MYGIGVEMMMEVMVSVLLVHICSEIDVLFLLLDIHFLSFLLFAVVLFCSREHENCGPLPGYVRAHIESRCYFFSLIMLIPVF